MQKWPATQVLYIPCIRYLSDSDRAKTSFYTFLLPTLLPGMELSEKTSLAPCKIKMPASPFQHSLRPFPLLFPQFGQGFFVGCQIPF